MPWKANHKDNTRQQILASAARLFVNKGFDAVSIDEVMNDAGLTRGAFYTHFESKNDLYSQAIISGASTAKSRFEANGGQTIKDFAKYYLQLGTDADPDSYCPLAFLVSDITHQDKSVREVYTKVVKGYLKQLNQFDLNNSKALQAAVLTIGGLALSRSITDTQLKARLLDACMKGIQALD